MLFYLRHFVFVNFSFSNKLDLEHDQCIIHTLLNETRSLFV